MKKIVKYLALCSIFFCLSSEVILTHAESTQGRIHFKSTVKKLPTTENPDNNGNNNGNNNNGNNNTNNTTGGNTASGNNTTTTTRSLPTTGEKIAKYSLFGVVLILLALFVFLRRKKQRKCS